MESAADPHPATPLPAGLAGRALALAVWTLGWIALLTLPAGVDLANRAMLLVLAAALASVWLPLWMSLAASVLGVLGFNWCFVPPRFTFHVSLQQDALLLLAMLGVNAVVAAVVSRQRQAAARAQGYAQRVSQLQRLAQALRDAQAPAQQAGLLQDTLAEVLGARPHLLVLPGELPALDDAGQALVLGQPGAHELAGLWQCLRRQQPLGPGTGRHEELPEWYFPLRGGGAAFGAAMLRLDDGTRRGPEVQAQAQALCDQMGLVLQRAAAQRQAAAAREEAQLQAVRNAMLAAISHDYRTPLAAILGAASSLKEQGARLSAAQRARLLDNIQHETEQLARLADNTLQLARLEAPGVQLSLDWESPEELAGALLARARRREPGRRLHARVEPGLPLVRCDAMLMMQLLENLVDNAFKYSEPPAPVELLVRRQPGHTVFAVRDRGPGVEPAWRERIFQVFQRGEARLADTGRASRSAGVGLAVCRAIAAAQGGELKLRPRGHGGASFECWLPEQPLTAPGPVEEEALRQP